ncbi:hypothetical protein [Methylobrevis albus]|uniref:Uncharacterized protein n=1 Tax=Methylobrevis albus TaxID=2793297 RepID=A0A931I0X7_9HYPH|nr:hypothetical protein [Methylobrevis albus]MBH0237226.1 hypothetical protein [Methylobrevis albus]
MKKLCLFLALIALLTPPPVAAQPVERLQIDPSVVMACAAGMNITLTSDQLGAIQDFLFGHDVSGRGGGVEVTTNFLELFEPAQRPDVLRIYHACILGLVRPPTPSRINPRDQMAVPVLFDMSSRTYYEHAICTDPAIRMHFQTAWDLRRLGGEDADTRFAPFKTLLDQILGPMTSDPFVKEIAGIDPASIDCSGPRACEVRGIVPVTALSEPIRAYDATFVRITVNAGTCEGRTGWINERFIDY